MGDEGEIVTLIKGSRFFFGGKDFLAIEKIAMLKSISIWDINWRIRFNHTLHTINEKIVVENLEQLLNTHFEEFMKIRNCGITTIEQARQTIINFILSFSCKTGLENYEKAIKETDEKLKFAKSYPFSKRLSISFESLKKYLNISLQEFEFPIRFNQYVTTISKVSNLRELLSLDPNVLIQKRNIGRKTIIDVSKIIDEKIKRLEHGLEKVEERNIVVIINNILNKISDRERAILKMRWAGKDETSLEEIGSHFELTRERIRQIIQRVVNKIWMKIGDYAEHYRKEFLDYIIYHPAPITGQIFYDNNGDLLYHHRLYSGLLAEIFQEVPFYDFMPLAFDQYFSRQIENNPSWATIHEVLRKLKVGHKEITPPKLREILVAHNLDYTHQLLCFKILFGLKKYFFFKEGDKYYLLRKGGIREMAYMILKNNEAPLNIEKIMAMIHKYYYEGSKYEAISSVIGNLKQDERIIQFDKYVFGVHEHFAYSLNEWEKICLVAKNFLEKGRRQYYVTEILEDVRKQYPLIRSKYELVYILRSDSEIIDLGFFNYSLNKYGVEERLKMTDAIKKLFEEDPRPKHFTEIQRIVSEQRFTRIEGMNSILKSQSHLHNYTGGFFGPKNLHVENLHLLAKCELYLSKIISYEIFPDTTIKRVLEFFPDNFLEETIRSTINQSNVLHIYENIEDHNSFIISKQWSPTKITRCILFNLNRPIFWDELTWYLNDLGIQLDSELRHKIHGNKNIDVHGNKLKHKSINLEDKDAKEITDICYEMLKSNKEPSLIEKICDIINNEFIEITQGELIYLLENDDRFIMMDGQLVMVS